MNIPQEYKKDFEAFPTALRELLEAELAAGNEIAEIGHGFPAPPVGAYIRLAKPLATRPRASGDGIDYYDRKTRRYSGEITDSKRFFFLLEPPHPPEPEPDMDAIRASRQASQSVDALEQIERVRKTLLSGRTDFSKPQSTPSPQSSPSKTAVERFKASMIMNYEKWHEGIGYDLEIIENATPEEFDEIEKLLVNRPVSDWRDVEALAALDSPRAQALLRKTLKGKDAELAAAVSDYAPDLVSDKERTAALIAVLEGGNDCDGLTQALLQVEEFHPPKIVETLFRGLLSSDGDTAVHFSAMLMFIHGKAESSFDWDQRPFFLRFQTEVDSEREAAFLELCEKLGVDANAYLAAPKKRTELKSQNQG